MTAAQTAAECLAGVEVAAHRIYLGRGCKVGGHTLGGSAHHPTGFVVAPQFCIQSHPVPVSSALKVSQVGLAVSQGRHVGSHREGQAGKQTDRGECRGNKKVEEFMGR